MSQSVTTSPILASLPPAPTATDLTVLITMGLEDVR